MTPCNKPVSRVFDSAMVRDGGKLKRLVVTFYPNGTLGIRPEKTRRAREEAISIEAVYSVAIKQRVALEQREKNGVNKIKIKRGKIK